MIRRLITTLAVVGAAAAGLAGPAQAERLAPQRIDSIGHATGPNTVAGTWTGVGAVNDAGTYTEQVQIVGDQVTIEKTLIGATGSRFVLRARGTIVFASPCTLLFQGGFWWMTGRTADGRRAVAGGSPGATADSFVDVCTGAVKTSHAGFAVVGGHARDD
jgi:hypothetical protein